MAYVFSMPDEVGGYKLQERIGAGGMGEVYKAYNPSLHRLAAIKILHQDHFTERFKNEASIQASINHPNIARLYEFSKIGGRDCIVMEYVEGESLDELLKNRRKLTPREATKIIIQIAAALSYLHKKEIIHRDIKPQNIKIQPDGTVKMLDFGIAKHKLSPKLTQTGFVVGTLEYLSPEQLLQKPELKSDIWSLGVLSYELVTGYLPFESTTIPGLHDKIRKGNFTNPEILVPDIPSNLCNLIDKCLRINPSSRIPANEVQAILGVKDTVTPKNHLERQRKISFDFRKVIVENRAWVMLAGGVLLLLIIISFFWGNGNHDGNEANSPGNAPTEVKAAGAHVLPSKSSEGVLISTPGIDDAFVVLPDGSNKPLPYEIQGKEGDSYDLTIRANGYQDKKVQVEITPRRLSYEYNLVKSDE